MNATATEALITGAAADFSGAILVILGITIGIGVGFLVFRKGWKFVKGSLS